jgi:hypothetical protein
VHLLGRYSSLQVFRRESGMLGDAGEHFRADCCFVAKSPDVVRVAGPLQCDVRGTAKGGKAGSLRLCSGQALHYAVAFAPASVGMTIKLALRHEREVS